jgi:hypothetical protein
MKTYFDATRKDAVEAVAVSIVAGVTKAITTHGDDPEQMPIIVLGFELAIKEIEREINPAFRLALVERLKEGVKS